MCKPFIKTAAIIGALSVAIGAFGAHALKEKFTPDALNIFETAVRYQFYHVFAVLAAGILFKEYPNKWIKYAGKLFIAGIIIFCGSLYLLTTIKGLNIEGMNWVGAITPLGGIAFIAGWLSLFIGVSKK